MDSGLEGGFRVQAPGYTGGRLEFGLGAAYSAS